MQPIFGEAKDTHKRGENQNNSQFIWISPKNVVSLHLRSLKHAIRE
jgi:hypothetical protein